MGAVLSFLPQIVVLFAFISILEDTGYMSRVAFMLDRLTRKFGLSGRAFFAITHVFWLCRAWHYGHSHIEK